MPNFTPRSLTRLGVFIDGHFYHKISTYFANVHPRHARINLRGFLQYITHVAAIEEDVDPAATRVVETHYFRGRVPTDRVHDHQFLADERRWDDILTREGVITHYLPTSVRGDGDKDVEKGVDVWLALEALELTRLKGLDVVVLFSGDGDFVPLLRKIHTLGARTLLPVWEIGYNDAGGTARYIRTSSALSREANYIHRMLEVIDSKPVGVDPLVDSLFMGGGGSLARRDATPDEAPRAEPMRAPIAPPPAERAANDSRSVARVTYRPSPAPFAAVPRDIEEPQDGDLVLGRVVALKNHFGFVRIPRTDRDAFFHANFLEDASFSAALDGQWIEGYLQVREDGTVQLHEIRVHWDLDEAGVKQWFVKRAADLEQMEAEEELEGGGNGDDDGISGELDGAAEASAEDHEPAT